MSTFREYLGLVEDHLPAAEFNALERHRDNLDENFLSSIRYWVTTVAGGLGGEYGYVNGPTAKARFAVPLGIEVTTRNDKVVVFVSDAGNRRIRTLTLP